MSKKISFSQITIALGLVLLVWLVGFARINHLRDVLQSEVIVNQWDAKPQTPIGKTRD